MQNEPLILDLLEWLHGHPRPYFEVMEAWRASCPRFSVWEDALDAGLVRVVREGRCDMVHASLEGETLLLARGRVRAG